MNKFLDTSSKEYITGLDGIRVLNALGLYTAHKTFALFYNPYVNKTRMIEVSLGWQNNQYSIHYIHYNFNLVTQQTMEHYGTKRYCLYRFVFVNQWIFNSKKFHKRFRKG